jgi:hypothetical protein
MSMCDELGPGQPYMEKYVQEIGIDSLCSVSDGSNCDKKSLAYLEKFKTKDAVEWRSQLERLSSLEGGHMKEDLKAWVRKRKKILRALLKEDDSKKKSEL